MEICRDLCWVRGWGEICARKKHFRDRRFELGGLNVFWGALELGDFGDRGTKIYAESGDLCLG